MLKEQSLMEQRYDAVVAVIRDGMTVSEVATKLGISRQSLYRWMARYEEGGIEALEDRSHRPRRVPHQMRVDVEVRALELRRRHMAWGPIRLHFELLKEFTSDQVPSHMALYRALVRHGLIEPRARRKRLRDYTRWERGHPMELWQLDVVGGFLLADGTELKALTGLDDHSRFCVSAQLMTRATGRPVCEAFALALRRHGIPEEVLTDNGKVFTNRFGMSTSEVLFDRICRENGIAHLLTAPRSPTTTGKIERFHRTLRREHLKARVFESLEAAQAELDTWVEEYNHLRPHQSLKMATPATRFAEPARPVPEVPLTLESLEEDRSGDDWVARTVSKNGTLSVSNQVFSVGKPRAGLLVDVRVREDLLEVWHGMELLKTVLRTSKGVVRKKKAEPHRRRTQ